MTTERESTQTHRVFNFATIKTTKNETSKQHNFTAHSTN